MVLDIAAIERELEAVTRQWQLTSDAHDRIAQHKREAREQQREEQRRQSLTQPPNDQHRSPAAAHAQRAPSASPSLSPRQRSRADRRRTEETAQPAADKHAQHRESWIVLPTWEQPTSPQPPPHSPQLAASPTPSPAPSSRYSAARPSVASSSPSRRKSFARASVLSEARSHLRLLHSRTQSVSRPGTASLAPTQRTDRHRFARAATARQPSRSPSRSPPHTHRTATAPIRPAGSRHGSSAESSRRGADEAIDAAVEQKHGSVPVPSAAFLARVQAWQDKYEQQKASRQPTTRQRHDDEEWEQCTFVPHVSHAPPVLAEPAAAHAPTRASRLAAEHTYQTHFAPPPAPPAARPVVQAAVSRDHVDAAHQRYIEQQQAEHSHYPHINAVSLVLADPTHHPTHPRQHRTRESQRQTDAQHSQLTFHPAVDPQSERLVAALPADFLFRQRVLRSDAERREEQRAGVEQERLQREAPFQPQLDEDVWREQAMVGRPVDVAERLYDVEQERRMTGSWTGREKSAVQAAYADCTFRPRINSNSTVFAYAKLQREASSSTTVSTGSSSGSSISSRSSDQLSHRGHSLGDDELHDSSPSPHSERLDSTHSPAINFRSRLLCLDTGRHTQHQHHSNHYHTSLEHHHTRLNHATYHHTTAIHCTHTPAINPSRPASPPRPHPVPGVSAYLNRRALVVEQRQWRTARERTVFMVDAAEGPGRRGGTEVRQFRLLTDERGRQGREALARDQAARRNRDG